MSKYYLYIIAAFLLGLIILQYNSEEYTMNSSVEYSILKAKTYADCFNIINTQVISKNILLDENSVRYACRNYSEQEAEKEYKKLKK